MKLRIRNWHIAGTVFIILFGTILHFVYEWSNNNTLVGIFGAVNESTWEHLKLLFWPALFFSIFEYLLIGKYFNNYITAKAISLYVGLLLIISLFYTYTGILGRHYLAVDIAIFIISVMISQNIGYRIITSNGKVSRIGKIISLIAIIILIIAFGLFTFNPPQIPLFKDPSSGDYGI
ncbi:DUF6512 family protein [Anaerosolibacter sp.]|uniref:DUF6512 family protein n=1 Tax=Anaerosolibacter sp. TaxID=1872527 RepID=UPI0039EFB8B8